MNPYFYGGQTCSRHTHKPQELRAHSSCCDYDEGKVFNIIIQNQSPYSKER